MASTTSDMAKQAMLDAGVLIEGHFVFADGNHADQKLEVDNLWNNLQSLDTILDLLAQAQELPHADVMLGVPRGGQRLAQDLISTGRTNIPIVLLERIPGGKKQDFRFVSDEDKRLALNAKSIRIYEDVVTTMSSIAGVVRLLDPTRQKIHSLTIWRRGKVKPEYRQGITDHYLVEEEMVQYPASKCKNQGCVL